MVENTPSLGHRIKAARERLGWSQAELARQLGISPYGLHMLESGKTAFPRTNRLVQLADTLHVSTDYLLGRSAKPTCAACS